MGLQIKQIKRVNNKPRQRDNCTTYRAPEFTEWVSREGLVLLDRCDVTNDVCKRYQF